MSTFKTGLSRSKAYERQGYRFKEDRVITKKSLCQHLKRSMGDRIIMEQSLCQHL